MRARPPTNALSVAVLCGLTMLACRSKSKKTPAAEMRVTASPADARTVATTPERVLLGDVRIEIIDPESGPEVELYPRELAQKLGRQLTQSPFFEAREKDLPEGFRPRRAAIELRIVYDVVERGERKALTAAVAIESRVVWQQPSDELSVAENVFVERPIDADERSPQSGVMAGLVADTLAQVGHGMIAKEQVRVGGIEALRQALEADDVDMVHWALELIAERKPAELFDATLEKLGSSETVIRDRALGALVAYGDPRAVDALAKRAAFDDHEFMRMVIEAVTHLGGKDAREYLEFIKSGHPDDAIRAHAVDGLRRLGDTTGQ